jgi:hypothetical protein
MYKIILELFHFACSRAAQEKTFFYRELCSGGGTFVNVTTHVVTKKKASASSALRNSFRSASNLRFIFLNISRPAYLQQQNNAFLLSDSDVTASR